MKLKQKRNSIRWFWRSFTVTFLILICCISLVLGIAFCRQRMESALSGEKPPSAVFLKGQK